MLYAYIDHSTKNFTKYAGAGAYSNSIKVCCFLRKYCDNSDGAVSVVSSPASDI